VSSIITRSFGKIRQIGRPKVWREHSIRGSYSIRNKSPIYLGPASAVSPIIMCATKADHDYNPISMGYCAPQCPVQRKYRWR
jgi:hypothetical protein